MKKNSKWKSNFEISSWESEEKMSRGRFTAEIWSIMWENFKEIIFALAFGLCYIIGEAGYYSKIYLTETYDWTKPKLIFLKDYFVKFHFKTQ